MSIDWYFKGVGKTWFGSTDLARPCYDFKVTYGFQWQKNWQLRSERKSTAVASALNQNKCLYYSTGVNALVAKEITLRAYTLKQYSFQFIQDSFIIFPVYSLSQVVLYACLTSSAKSSDWSFLKMQFSHKYLYFLQKINSANSGLHILNKIVWLIQFYMPYCCRKTCKIGKIAREKF